MNESLLREFVRKSLLSELHLDKRYLSSMGIHFGHEQKTNDESRLVALHWIEDIEHDIERPIGKYVEAKVIRFVAANWQKVLAKFNGNERAALQTLNNMLDEEFNYLTQEALK